jgi:sorbitol-specific phosphotransferase system component IIBC
VVLVHICSTKQLLKYDTNKKQKQKQNKRKKQNKQQREQQAAINNHLARIQMLQQLWPQFPSILFNSPQAAINNKLHKLIYFLRLYYYILQSLYSW